MPIIFPTELTMPPSRQPPNNDLPPVADRPLRRCVGIALFNREGRVWLGKRRTSSGHEANRSYQWQLPQGGIDSGENPEDAVFRELHEETGVRNARIIGEIDDWLYYEFPPELTQDRFMRHKGQTQKWYALLFTGEDSEVDLEVHEPEFETWRWAALEEITDLVIPFKRDVYERVVKEFGPVSRRLADGETL